MSLGHDEIVPYFQCQKNQIIFEFIYLIVSFLICVALLLGLHLCPLLAVDSNTKIMIFGVAGGFLGGWVFVTKWFYRVTARGKNNQYGWTWESHKFYWRIFTPFISSVIAFVTYILITSDFFSFKIGQGNSARGAFSVCFVLGYFSDFVMSRLAAWVENSLGKKKKIEDVS